MTISPTYLQTALTPVRLVQTSNLAGNYSNGPSNNGVGATLEKASAGALTIDSVDAVAGDRVALVSQTNTYESGIYEVVEAGDSGTPWLLQRSFDFQSIEQMKEGQFFTVRAGTVNAGTVYVVISPLPGAIGVDEISIVSSTSESSLGTMALQNANDVAITGGTVTDITDLAIADGGTGSSTAAAALTAFGVKRGTTAAYAGGGTSNAFTATGLASTDIVTATILTSTNSVSITKAVPTTNTLTVTFSADPGASTTVQWHALPV